MKRIVFVSMFLIAAIYSNAQDAGKIIFVRIYQETVASTSKWSSCIRITYSDSKSEVVELERLKDQKDFASSDANDKKIRNALDKISSMGYEIKSSEQSPYGAGIFIITTYVFEKK